MVNYNERVKPYALTSHFRYILPGVWNLGDQCLFKILVEISR